MGNADQSRAADEVERLRKALDEETRERLDVQRHLDQANGEFEEFVSLAAHNLRQSFRYVASFSQLMAETYADRLDSEGALFLSLQSRDRAMAPHASKHAALAMSDAGSEGIPAAAAPARTATSPGRNTSGSPVTRMRT